MTNAAYKAMLARKEANARFDLEHSDWLVAGQWQRMQKPGWVRQQPNRVDQDCAGEWWAIWTRLDDTPGSRNNYIVAGGIQHEHEAVELCQAANGRIADKVAALVLCRAVLNDYVYGDENVKPEMCAMAEALNSSCPHGCVDEANAIGGAK